MWMWDSGGEGLAPWAWCIHSLWRWTVVVWVSLSLSFSLSLSLSHTHTHTHTHTHKHSIIVVNAVVLCVASARTRSPPILQWDLKFQFGCVPTATRRSPLTSEWNSQVYNHHTVELLIHLQPDTFGWVLESRRTYGGDFYGSRPTTWSLGGGWCWQNY